jgi:hypothetical protein
LSYYRPKLDHYWEIFGADRLIYGSDWPNSETVGTYAQVFGLVREYFIAKARSAPRTVIPLEELRSIRSDAPPAVVRQPEARRLLTRSAIVGYGKPIGGAVLAALFAVGFVVVGATERVWRTVDSPNHWDALSWKGSRGSVYAQRTSLASDPNKPRVIVGGSSRFFGEDSPGLTVWDAHDGRLIGAISRQNLSIAGGRIWDYDNQTGRLIGLDATGKETSSVATPDDGRPPGRMRVGDFGESTGHALVQGVRAILAGFKPRAPRTRSQPITSPTSR